MSRSPLPRTVRLPGVLAGAALSVLLVAGSCGGGGRAPSPGQVDYQRPALLSIPGAAGLQVNGAGGNLMLHRTDLRIDTRLGAYEIGATYNAGLKTARGWRWSFEPTYDGAVFVDPTGAVHAVDGLADGAPIPGTHWTRVDATRIATRGGLLYRFHASRGDLLEIRRRSATTPRLRFVKQTVHPPGGPPGIRTDRIEQCTSAGCALVFDLDYEAGQLVRVTDRAGRGADYAWDAEGRLERARDGLDVERSLPGFRYEYASGGGLLTAFTNSEGERVELGYAPEAPAARNRVSRIRQVGEENPTWELGYASAGGGKGRTTVTDPLGHAQVLVYDRRARVRRLRNGAQEETRWEWSGLRPVRRVAPDGTATTTTWADDALATRTGPDGNTLRFAYEPGAVNRSDLFAPPPRRVEDDLGVLEERAYDAQGRLVAVTNGAGETTTFGYGEDQMRTRITSPAGVVVKLRDHGAHGHPTRVVLDDHDRSRVYDAVGNLLEGDDLSFDAGPGLGGVVRRRFDADRNLAEVDLARDCSSCGIRVLRVVHRSDGRRLRIERPYGGDTHFVYDGLGRLVERKTLVDGSFVSTHFERDALGRLRARERANGMRVERGYDAAGRLVLQRILEDGTVQGGALRVHQGGRLVAIHDAAHDGVAERYHYDPAGRIVSVTYPEGERVELGYDGRSRLVAADLRMASGALLRSLSFEHDGANRETELLDGGVSRLRREYVDGQLQAVHFGNGLTRRFTHHPERGTIRAARLENESGEVLEESTYLILEEDPCTLGPCVIAETRSFGALAATSREHHVLAPRGSGSSRPGRRLALSAPSPGVTRYYSYNEIANPMSGSQGGPVAYNHERNRLLSYETTGQEAIEYTYDESGYVIGRSGVGLDWDGAGRITAWGDRRFAWDAQGRPVSRSWQGLEVGHRFGGLVQTGASRIPVALDLGAVRLDLLSGEHRYRHRDYRGNVKLVSNQAGEVVSHVHYHGYGVEQVFGSEEDPLRFAGGQAVGDLTLLGARAYDPASGRFLSPDPVFQLINQYAYALGNPIQLWDPFGLEGRVLGYTAADMQAAVGGGGGGAAFVALLAPGGQPAAASIGTATFIAVGVLEVVKGLGGFPDGNFGPDLNPDGIDANAGASGSGGSVGGSSSSSQGLADGLGLAAHARAGTFTGMGGGGGGTIQIKSLTISVIDDSGFGGGSFGCAPTELGSVGLPAQTTVALLGLHVAIAGVVLARRARGQRSRPGGPGREEAREPAHAPVE